MKTYKRLFPILLCVVLAVVALTATVYAADIQTAANVYVNVDKTSAFVGDEITVTFSTNAVQCTTLTGGIHYDPEQLEFVSVEMAEANGNKLLINSAGRDAFRLVGVEHKINDGGRTGRVGFYSVGTSLNGVEAESFAATDLFVATFKVLKTGEITITAYEDSYQGENNENVDSVTITATEKPAGLKGDVDLDGEVATLDDVTVLARHYMNYELIEDQQAFANGDIDGDGEITLDDFTALVRYYMGYDETLG